MPISKKSYSTIEAIELIEARTGIRPSQADAMGIALAGAVKRCLKGLQRQGALAVDSND